MDQVVDLAQSIVTAREHCLVGEYATGAPLFRECVRMAMYMRRVHPSPEMRPLLDAFVASTKREYAVFHRYMTTLALLKRVEALPTINARPRALESLAYTYSSPPPSPATLSRKRRRSIIELTTAKRLKLSDAGSDDDASSTEIAPAPWTFRCELM
ncbi:hypothetical protein SPRG_08806 [Saprolegnia parasitica CBS 223.65]|uniref:Uncharacterized protein n=1 Tax=Saprolegnia parasitica (strain CBS 223.65) TaxID=695850 RepID=A0A067C5S1_SAPPC|nr:hypothetical protein SPRG_08806 [Saprolegnia parasitica CBS 223.65]KDO25863.1 hypothetical protein SPRG_08806 [Saprolegnia parasitica CBS 223.65]|eukprot:XP_012203425.1 hypothetical protein SPRG_08806 [Saprolegnia parasitica CBS 223.65]